jgi:hypothetical protein
LWSREAFYLSMERETALPTKRATLDQVMRVPVDWKLHRVEHITKEMREKMRGLAGAFVECAWSEARGIFTDTDYRLRVRDAPNWLGDSTGRRRQARLLGLSCKNAIRYLAPSVRFPLSHYYRQVRKSVWLPCEVLPTASMDPVASVDSDKSDVESWEWDYAVGPRAHCMVPPPPLLL